MGPRVTPGSVQLVRRSPWGQGLGDLLSPGEPGRIRELAAHRILEVVGVARAERLQSEKALREGWDEGWVRRGVVRHPAGARLQGRDLSPCQHRLGRPFQGLWETPVQVSGDHRSTAHGDTTGQRRPWLPCESPSSLGGAPPPQACRSCWLSWPQAPHAQALCCPPSRDWMQCPALTQG